MFTEITRQLTTNSFVEKVWPPLVIRVQCWQYWSLTLEYSADSTDL
jgi:hypothetical protein